VFQVFLRRVLEQRDLVLSKGGGELGQPLLARLALSSVRLRLARLQGGAQRGLLRDWLWLGSKGGLLGLLLVPVRSVDALAGVLALGRLRSYFWNSS